LNLTDNQISGNIPNFDLMPLLRGLYLGGNELTGTVPDFKAIPELTHLYINHNQLSGSLPNFGHIPKVLYIYSEHNQLSGPIPEFTNLPNLSGIQFFNNQFSGALPEFRNCPSLSSIQVYNNQVSGTCPAYGYLNQLTYLELYNNNLSGTLPKLNEFSLLRDVPIQNNRYTFGPIISRINFINFRPRVTYAPQQKIYVDTFITIPTNSNYTLDLLIDDTVTTSTYMWFKNDALYKTIKGSNKLLFTPFTNNDAGTYNVKITNSLANQLTLESWPIKLNVTCNSSSIGSLNSDQQKIKYQTSQLFDVLANDSITKGSPLSVLIDNPPNGSILYSQTTGKGTYTPRQKFSGKEILNYTVCAINCPGVCKSSTIEFNIEAPCADRNSLTLPNVIFPTGPTGSNRYFFVEALEKCPDAFGPKHTKLMVYNRWGDLVFHTNDYQNNWDGNNTKGDPLPEGTYYYLLDLGSISAPLKGYVVIVR